MTTLKKIGGAAAGVCAVSAMIAIVLANGEVRTNPRGLELIGNAESCRREPYVCPAGVLTDGIGNTHGVISGTVKSDAQIAADWQSNILDAESCVNRYASGHRLPDSTFSAATSVTFRAGCGNMRGSQLFRLLRGGMLAPACEQFPRWIYGGGRVLPGLVARAEKERALCLDGLSLAG